MFRRSNHSNLGVDWEAQLIAIHDVYRLRGVCDIVLNPREWVFVSDVKYNAHVAKYGPGFVAVCGTGRKMIRTRSDVDFSGGGKGFGLPFSICFDAKSCKAKTFPLTNFASHQIARLRVSAKCGCIAGFMVRMEAFDRVFFVPSSYAALREEALLRQTGRRAKPGTASISIAEMEDEAVEISRDKNGMWDWAPELVGKRL